MKLLKGVGVMKKIVFDLEEIVCNFCDADSSNCSYCSVRDQIIDALLDNNIEIEEPIK